MEISHFFKYISFNKLHIQHIKTLKTNIVYKFKMIFFFLLIEAPIHIFIVLEKKMKTLSSINKCIHSKD
jgi:hypothetical protein